MRKVKIPLSKVKEWVNSPSGVSLVIPVLVNWPELQLTEEQRLENAIALVNGEREPHEDNALFEVEIDSRS